MQGMSILSLPESRAFASGSLVRGRVVQSANGQSFFEYAGGRIALAKTDGMPTGWHTYKVEQGPGGLRLTLLQGAADKGAALHVPAQAHVQTQRVLFQGGATGGIERLFSFLYPDRKLLPRTSGSADGNECKKSLAQAFLKSFFSLKPDALEKVFAAVREKSFAEFIASGAREDSGAEGADRKQPSPCLLRLDMPFLQEGGIPIFVVPQDGEHGAGGAIWLFSEIDLEGLGHTSFCLRLTESRLDGDIYCEKGCRQTIEACLPASLASLRVYEREEGETRQAAGEFYEWALMRIMQACPGECDTYV